MRSLVQLHPGPPLQNVMLSLNFLSGSFLKNILVILIIALVAGSFGYYLAAKPLGPVLTTAGIVHICPENKIALIERAKAPKGLAMFGGHVENNESPEQAFRRELAEELNISKIDDLHLVGVHGDFGRDPRQHSVEITYSCTSIERPKAGSDAKSVKLYSIAEVEDKLDVFAFDHGDILKKYLAAIAECNPCQQTCYK